MSEHEIINKEQFELQKKCYEYGLLVLESVAILDILATAAPIPERMNRSRENLLFISSILLSEYHSSELHVNDLELILENKIFPGFKELIVGTMEDKIQMARKFPRSVPLE